MSIPHSNPIKQQHKSMRNQGFRLVRIWLPDTRREGFAEECRRQSLSLRDDPQEAETLDWLANVADTEGWQ
ncbi:antitoxin MazE family protein [Methylomagnum sp.]